MTEPATTPDPTLDPTPDATLPGGSRLLLLSAVVALAGLGGVALAAATDRLDSALLFVGVPCLLAFGIGAVRGRGGWGTVFQVLTVVLLLASALLQEAAVCVLLAAPLVYGVAAVVYGAVAYSRRRTGSLVLVPVVAMVLVEGVLPGTRIHPDQSATAERVVAARCADFQAALTRGPRFDPAADRGALLRVFPYPTPTVASGDGLAVGDTWTLDVAGGQLQTHVTDRRDASLTFAVDADTTKLERWVTVRGGSLTWAQGSDGCRATVTVDYGRHLDPALYFGPLSDVFMDAGAAAFLAALD